MLASVNTTLVSVEGVGCHPSLHCHQPSLLPLVQPDGQALASGHLRQDGPNQEILMDLFPLRILPFHARDEEELPRPVFNV